MTRGALFGLFWGFKGSETLNLRKSRFLFGPPLCFPMKLKLSAAISKVPQLFGRSRLAPSSKINQNWKTAKNRGKSRILVGRPLGFPSPQKERALSEVYPFIISSCCTCGKGSGGGLHRDLRGVRADFRLRSIWPGTDF